MGPGASERPEGALLCPFPSVKTPRAQGFGPTTGDWAVMGDSLSHVGFTLVMWDSVHHVGLTRGTHTCVSNHLSPLLGRFEDFSQTIPSGKRLPSCWWVAP